jgi:hypothetical protein
MVASYIVQPVSACARRKAGVLLFRHVAGL